MLAVSGSPHVVGFTIDTLNNPEDGQAIVDAWVSGEADVSGCWVDHFDHGLTDLVFFLCRTLPLPMLWPYPLMATPSTLQRWPKSPNHLSCTNLRLSPNNPSQTSKQSSHATCHYFRTKQN